MLLDGWTAECYCYGLMAGWYGERCSASSRRDSAAIQGHFVMHRFL